MPGFSRSGDLAIALTLVVVGAVAIWLVLQQGTTAAASVDPSAPMLHAEASSSDAQRGPASGSATARQGADRPAGERANEEGGTRTITVREGMTVDLHAAPGGEVVEQLSSRTEFGSATVLSVAEVRGEWAGVPTQLLPNGELGWVRLDSDAIAIDSVGVEIVVDLSEMQAKLMRNGETEHSWTIGIGAPDTPTPTGRFSITDTIEGGLNPVYGCCALALSATQPNLPPGWTGGNRMAIHGTSEALGEANSAGCVRSGEADLHLLMERVPLGTPVTIQS